MDSGSGREKIRWEPAGLFMVLAVSEIVIRSACLTEPGAVPWLWSLLFFLAAAAPWGMNFGNSSLKATGMSAALLLLLLMGALRPVLGEALILQQGEGWRYLLNGLRQIGGYLSGSAQDLSQELQTAAINSICCFSALVFIGFREWKKRTTILGIATVFGCIRWNQYVPDMEGALLLAVLAWCFSAAMEGRGKGRLMISVLLTAGVFGATVILSTLFPLESLNRWAGGWVPNQEIFRNEYTKYGQTGFQLENTPWYPLHNRLGGAVTLDKEPVMQVRASRPGLYLRGMVKSIYTGQTWEAEPEAWEPVVQTENTEGASPFVLTIHPFNNRDRTLFAPLNSDAVTAEGRDVLMGRDGVYRLGFQWFPSQRTSYRVQGFLETPENNPLTQREPYLQLPELDPVLRAKAVEIAGNGTDAERMERLTNWLRINGTYRLDVVEPSEEHDFVEQFVLGSREGYCTYFATALAVMGRISGVPTRYVEGYLLPDQISGRQTYIITSDRAHAWVEAYVSGKGWVVYEPTPAFGNGAADQAVQPADQEDAQVAEPLKALPGIPADTDVPAPVGAPTALTAGLLILLLGAARITWVEFSWRKGSRGPHAGIWKLYAVLSALTLMLPEIKNLKTPAEKLNAAASNFTLGALGSHDIIKDTNRLLYGRGGLESDGFQEILSAVWQEYRQRQGTIRYLYSRYGSLALFNSYDTLIRHRHFRKEDTHGADQPHTSPQP